MKKQIIALALLLTSFNSFAINCKAIDRQMTADAQIIESEVQLDKVFDSSTHVQFQAEVKNYLYFLTYDKIDQSGLMQIIQADDNTVGLVSRSAFSKSGVMSLSRVDGQNVQRIECSDK